jgi:Ca2+-binding RTX toxin-like protein
MAGRATICSLVAGAATSLQATALTVRIAPDGNDQLYGNIGDDFLKGYGGSDLLKGGSGSDQIDAADLFYFDTNPGQDTVMGGGGDDEIEAAQDGSKDTIDCGAGFDRVLG